MPNDAIYERYCRKTCLRESINDHDQSLDGISGSFQCLTFSSDGQYIAAGGDGKKVLLIETATGRVKFVLITQSIVTSLSWMPTENILNCGLANGTVARLLPDVNKNFIVFGMRALNSSVNHIAVDRSGLLFAFGGNNEIRIFSRENITQNHYGGWKILKRLPVPPVIGQNSSSDVVVTALFWMDSESQQLLLACYLNHGVVLWDIHAATPALAGVSGNIYSASLSAEKSLLAISTGNSGFDVHDLVNKTPCCSIVKNTTHPLTNHAPPRACTIIHNGSVLLTGGDNGQALLWDIETGQEIETLDHGEPITALAACIIVYLLSTQPDHFILKEQATHDLDADRLLIATATLPSSNRSAALTIWESVKVNGPDHPLNTATTAEIVWNVATVPRTARVPTQSSVLISTVFFILATIAIAAYTAMSPL